MIHNRVLTVQQTEEPAKFEQTVTQQPERERDRFAVRPGGPTLLGVFSLSTVVLAGLVLVGAVLRLYLLADKSIWLGEAFSIILSQRSLGDLPGLIVETDAHPLLYYLALKLWLVLGESPGHVRLLSAIFSIISIPLMFLLASSLFEDTRAGLIGAAILALSPLHIWYAQEARMYAMLIFFVLASAYFLILALRDGRPRDWVAYVLTTTIALYTDYGAIWYVAAVTAFYLLSWRRFPGRARAWLLSLAAIILLYLPWLPSLLAQLRQVNAEFWLPAPTFQTILNVFLDFNSLNFPWIALSVLYMTVIFVWAFIVPGRAWQRRLTVLWLSVPLLLALLLSLRQPVFLSRNLIAASLAYYLLIVGTVMRFNSTQALVLLLAPLFLMNLVSIGYNAWREEKENWSDLTVYVAERAQAVYGGLAVFVPAYAELPFAYYSRQHDLSLDTQGFPQDDSLLRPAPKPVDDLASVLADRPFIWLVQRDVETVDPDWTVKDWLDNNGYVRGRDFVSGELSVLSYTRWDVLRDPWQAHLPEPASRSVKDLFLPFIVEGSSDAPEEPATHIVQSGETLLAISRLYGTTVEALVVANNIGNPDRISAGQVLIIP